MTEAVLEQEVEIEAALGSRFDSWRNLRSATAEAKRSAAADCKWCNTGCGGCAGCSGSQASRGYAQAEASPGASYACSGCSACNGCNSCS